MQGIFGTTSNNMLLVHSNCWDLQTSNSNKTSSPLRAPKDSIQTLKPVMAGTLPHGWYLFRGSTSYSNSLEEPMLKVATQLWKSDIHVFGRQNASTVLNPSSNLDKIRTHYRSETNCFRFYKKYPGARRSPMNPWITVHPDSFVIS